ncbi:unannotated protein [freshwater metagenome]|uniref:Unannotated protein n=1 Tax=freshwater metagenome TaxID=449393 RepID=A0A6J6HHK8_9ZZZZ
MAARPASIISSSNSIEDTDKSILFLIAVFRSSPSGVNQLINGAVTPAALSAIPSSNKAVPSQCAPAATAALATGIKPCPYASAFTTAKTCALLFALIKFKLCAMAVKSTSATARDMK